MRLGIDVLSERLNLNMPPMKSKALKFDLHLIGYIIVFFSMSCSSDSVDTDEIISVSPCEDLNSFLFIEQDGVVTVEFENAEFTGDWKLRGDGDNFSGKGYMVWEGPQHLHEPGNSTVTFKIRIKNTGTYQFLWNSAVKKGNSGTDHNDTWLRFADADDFYAKKGESTVYPKDSGKSPNPEGASKDGWFKIYRGGSDLDFKWQASTFDNNAHDVFIHFAAPGTYTMEISARSSGHGIDKFVLFKDMTKEEAISDINELSEITCY